MVTAIVVIRRIVILLTSKLKYIIISEIFNFINCIDIVSGCVLEQYKEKNYMNSE